MPVYRQEVLDRRSGSRRLFQRTDVKRRPTAMNLGNLGKITCRRCSAAFPKNDGSVLAKAISFARGRSGNPFVAAKGAAVGAAAARALKPVEHEVQKYVGRVKSLEGDEVIAQIGPPDEMDRWDVIIPRATFKQQPEVNQRIACTIVRWDSHADVTVQVLSKEPLPKLKDFGIDKEELLSWASQLDV